MDPDLGTGMHVPRCSGTKALTPPDIHGSDGVKMHYTLLLAIIRIINTAILSRGEQNEQTLAQGRKFLAENRLSVLTVFKRSANIGTLDHAVSDEIVDALAESYMLLITLTGFINVSSCII
jgi:nuclear pore complex protein Nup205